MTHKELLNRPIDLSDIPWPVDSLTPPYFGLLQLDERPACRILGVTNAVWLGWAQHKTRPVWVNLLLWRDPASPSGDGLCYQTVTIPEADMTGEDMLRRVLAVKLEVFLASAAALNRERRRIAYRAGQLRGV